MVTHDMCIIQSDTYILYVLTDYGDDAAFAERWSCKCKKYIGKMYEGKICEVCETPVESQDLDLTKFGWIIIDNFKVLSPIYDQKLMAALGKQDDETVLDKIVEVNYDDDGQIKFTEKEMLQIKKHPFMHKGMVWLSDPNNMLTVLEYYEKRRPKTQAKLFKELKDDLDKELGFGKGKIESDSSLSPSSDRGGWTFEYGSPIIHFNPKNIEQI